MRPDTDERITATAPARLITPSTVFGRTTLSRTTIWRMVRAGTFPAPLKISKNRIAWRESDVTDFIEGRSSPRRAD